MKIYAFTMGKSINIVLNLVLLFSLIFPSSAIASYNINQMPEVPQFREEASPESPALNWERHLSSSRRSIFESSNLPAFQSFSPSTSSYTNSSPIRASWSTDPGQNTPVSTAAYDQNSPQISSDGSGGAIITWADTHSGNWDIYAQRLNASGIFQWLSNGVAVSIASDAQLGPQIVSDGSGGAIITWQDYRNSEYPNADIYARRLNASGVPQWTANGVAVSIASDRQYYPQIISDGSGGAIITWQDRRSGNWVIYAQRLNASGVPQWTANGMAIYAAAYGQSSPQIIPDGSGGAIITWQDYRNVNGDIYAQRLNASGAAQWAASGVAVSTASGDQASPEIISDGSGGAIITWMDMRSGNWDIYAQRLDASGIPQWATNGVAVSTASDNQSSPQIVSDGTGGSVITWADNRSGSFSDIYAQRLDASGVPQWTANGAAVSTAPDYQTSPQIVSDGSGGAIIT